MKDRMFLEPAGVASRLFPACETAPRPSRTQQNAAHLLDAAENHDLDPAITYLACELVDLQPDLSDAESRALLCLVLISLFQQRQGSTYLPLDPAESPILLDALTALIPQSLHAKNPHWAPQNILADIHDLLTHNRAPLLIGQPGDYKPLLLENQRLYHQRMLQTETRLVHILARHLQRPFREHDPAQIRAALDDILTHAPHTGATTSDTRKMTLNAEQQYGVLTALHAPLSIITGGPGTGKTSIIVSILRILTRLGFPTESIALAAPTGKAANRMGESILAQLTNINEAQDSDPTTNTADSALLHNLQSPMTLHRLLGYSPSTKSFYHHENNPLDARIVIVDEASMIDLFMMERLVAALPPHANLVFLGDSEQLPSVDTGAVLRDLLPQTHATDTPWHALLPPNTHLPATYSTEPLAKTAVRLTTSYRMDTRRATGRKIHAFASALNDPARTTPLLELLDTTDQQPLISHRLTANKLEHIAVELFTPRTPSDDAPHDPSTEPQPVSLSAFADHWFTTRITNLPDFDDLIRATYRHDGARFDATSTERLTRLFDHLNTARVLTLTRVHTTGSARLNAAFHQRFLARRHGDADWDYVAGEPVMMLHNDYERGLFNGDQGVIVWIKRTHPHLTDLQSSNELAAVFLRDGQFVPYNLAALQSHIEHAFAMTIHKAQGSEFQHVALILPTHDIPLLTREILYTGTTRASTSVCIIGDPALLETGAARTTTRFSAITQRLARRLPTPEPATPPEKPTKKAPKRASKKQSSNPLQGSLFSFDD